MEVDGKQAIINRDILNRFEQLQRCNRFARYSISVAAFSHFASAVKSMSPASYLHCLVACRVIVVHLEILLMGTCQLYQGQRESLSDCLNDLE